MWGQPTQKMGPMNLCPTRNDQGNPAAAKNRCIQNPPDPPLGFTALFCHAWRELYRF
jgi:hypothetical protein